MTRFLFACLILVSTPVIAKDDGGFGTARFTSEAPAALGGESINNNQLATQQQIILEQNLADIETAAGEEDKPVSSVEKSNHKVEPYIIKKDLEVR
jgi:hypothetical protein